MPPQFGASTFFMLPCHIALGFHPQDDEEDDFDVEDEFDPKPLGAVRWK